MIEKREFLNAERIDLAAVPVVPFKDLYTSIAAGELTSMRRAALFCRQPANGTARLFLILCDETTNQLFMLSTDVAGKYPSLTADAPDLHLFERELFEKCAIEPTGHSWLKPVRFPPAVKEGRTVQPIVGEMEYFQVSGEEEHEVAVGPVHAGIIEPGHFRFQCHGELVHHLEISLGYQHRGIERSLSGGPNKRTVFQIETAAGDTTIGHAWAYCQLVESMAGVVAPDRAQYIRAVALELERIANHVGDLGALAQDVGYLPTSSYCGRIRGDVLNITADICGSRLGRSLVRPGGVLFDIEPQRQQVIISKLAQVEDDLRGAVDLMFQCQSVMARFEHVGTLSTEQARKLGILGPAARASGVPRDVRAEYFYGPYAELDIAPVVLGNGSVLCRAKVRYEEILRSFNIIRQLIQRLPHGGLLAEIKGSLRPNSISASFVEGWRGEIKHLAMTGDDGKFSCYKIVDPSFQNWTGLSMALRGQQISDFPLCNKSFNLSYCGFDL